MTFHGRMGGQYNCWVCTNCPERFIEPSWICTKCNNYLVSKGRECMSCHDIPKDYPKSDYCLGRCDNCKGCSSCCAKYGNHIPQFNGKLWDKSYEVQLQVYLKNKDKVKTSVTTHYKGFKPRAPISSELLQNNWR